MFKFNILKGDIVKSKTQAIVNAANTSLLGGGGVDGAIHRAAGPKLLEECVLLKGCKTGFAKITNGYKLKSEYVIHTPGPIWRGGERGERELLASCYRSCLTLAAEKKITSISFPSISTGVYRFPVDDAAHIAINEIMTFMYKNEDCSIKEINMVLFDENTQKAYKNALADYELENRQNL